MTPAIGRDHRVPAEEASVKLIPIDDPVPNQVQVKVKDNAPRDHSENRRGIACWYPAASSSRASLLAEAFEGVSAKLLMIDSQAQIVFAGRIEHVQYPETATKTLYEDPSRKRLSITRCMFRSSRTRVPSDWVRSNEIHGGDRDKEIARLEVM